MRCAAVLLALTTPSLTVAAQEPPPITAIRAGTLIDGTGAAPVRNAVILVQGDRITAVGAGVAIPKGATVVDLSAEHGSILDEEAVQLMKQHGTYLVPTLLAGYTAESLALAKRLPPAIAAKALAIAPRMRASFKLALDAGVKIALGTDAGVMQHGTNAREFGLMVKYGMTPMRAIQAGTLSGATLLGKDAEVGSLERGKLADIVAVGGDPVQDIRALQHVDFVMKGGAVFKQHGQVVGRSDAAIP